MNDKLATASQTYNTLEYLKVFIEFYDKYVKNYKLEVVCGGFTLKKGCLQ